MQMDYDPKQTAKETNVECLAMAKSINWPEFLLLRTKLKEKCPNNKQELKTAALAAWQSINQRQNPAAGDDHGFETSGCPWLQTICNQVFKSDTLFFDYVSLSNYLWSFKKVEAHIKYSGIPTHVHLIWM